MTGIKTLIVSVFLSASIVGCPVAGAAEGANGNTVGSFCKNVSDLSVEIMKARQDGVLLSDIIEKTKGAYLTKLVAMLAYDRPRFSAKENKRDAAVNFANDMYLACLRKPDAFTEPN